MALTQSELTTEIQAVTGREDDTVLITNARCTRFLNECQNKIVRVCTGHIDLETDDTTALTLVTDQVSYALSGVSPSVKHPLRLYYMDDEQSKELKYVDTDTFDADHPYPTDTSGVPREWTRRAGDIEIWPPPSSGENGKYLRLVYTKVPTAFATGSPTATCDMSDADHGLIFYGAAHAFLAIGDREQFNNFMMAFTDWLSDYQKDYDGEYLALAHILE
jgi:hypothetical protein